MKAVARKATSTNQTLTVGKKAPVWIRAGVIAIHKRTGNRYVVISMALDKTRDTQAVIYRADNATDGIYVRDLGDFAAKFVLDNQLAISLDAEGAQHSAEHVLINIQQNETANDCFAMMEALTECADHLDLNWTDAARERHAGHRLALQLRQHATQCRARGQQLAGT